MFSVSGRAIKILMAVGAVLIFSGGSVFALIYYFGAKKTALEHLTGETGREISPSRFSYR